MTNHAVVAMVGEDVKQTRCTTCDAEHEYKHAKVPRQRRKTDTPRRAVCAGRARAAPKRVAHDEPDGGDGHRCRRADDRAPMTSSELAAAAEATDHATAADAAVDAASNGHAANERRRAIDADDDDGDATRNATKKGRFIGR